MPNVVRSEDIFKASCVACQDLRRDSRGWVESRVTGWEGLVVLDEVFDEVVEGRERVGPTPERRVSWMPGAEGALREGVVWVGWDEEGTILIDCG